MVQPSVVAPCVEPDGATKPDRWHTPNRMSDSNNAQPPEALPADPSEALSADASAAGPADASAAGSVDPSTAPPVEDPRPTGLDRAESLLLVNTGDGKGKSSAAFGVMLRSVAAGWPVAVLQFIKNGQWKVGEEKIGRQLGVDWQSLGQGFTWDSTDLNHDKDIAVKAWSVAKQVIQAGEHRLVILDELTYLCTWGWIDTDDVVATLANRPPKTSIIVTGRDCPAAIIDIADTVTEMVNVKHAYDQGINAKKGIEY